MKMNYWQFGVQIFTEQFILIIQKLLILMELLFIGNFRMHILIQYSTRYKLSSQVFDVNNTFYQNVYGFLNFTSISNGFFKKN